MFNISNKSPVAVRLFELCERKGMTIGDIMRVSGMGRGMVSAWMYTQTDLSALRSSSLPKLARLADYLGVSVRYILKGEK